MRPNRTIDIAFKFAGWYWGFIYDPGPGLFNNGRKWVFMRPARCLCAWYGPDLYDGCSICGKEAESRYDV